MGRPMGYRPPVLPDPYSPVKLPGGDTSTPGPQVTDRVTERYTEREVLIPYPEGKRAIAYGRQRLAGQVLFAHYDPASDRMLYVVAFCAGECDALLAVTQPDGAAAPIGSNNVGLASVVPYTLNFWWYPGTAAGEVNARAQEVVPTWNEALPGTCYAVVELIGFSTQYWNAQLPNLLWEMRTRKCLDPATQTRAYSENAWTQWYDYARWDEGKGLPTSRVNAQSFVDARAADLAAGRAMDAHPLILEATDPDDVIKMFRIVTAAMWHLDVTAFRVIPDRPSSVVATYGDRHVDASVPVRGQRGDVRERPNRVKGWYTSISNGWERTPIVVETAAVTAGTEDPVESEYELVWLQDPAIARSRLVWLLNSAQYDFMLSERWLGITADRQLGDVVTRDIAERGITFTGRLVSRTRNVEDNTFDVQLVEYSSAKYSYDPVSAPAKVPSNLPDFGAAPDPVTGLTVLERTHKDQDGRTRSRLEITFDDPQQPFYRHTRVMVQRGSAAPYVLAEVTAGPVFVSNTEDLQTYTISAVNVSSSGRESAAAIAAPITTHAKNAPPSDVPGIMGGSDGLGVVLWWQPATDDDLESYEIRRGSPIDSWSSAQYLGRVKVTTFRDATPPAGTTVRYFVKAIDAAKQYSSNATTFDVAMNAPAGAAVAASDLTLELRGGPTTTGISNGPLVFTHVVQSSWQTNTGGLFADVGLWRGTGNLIVEITQLALYPGTGPVSMKSVALLSRLTGAGASPQSAENERSAATLTSVGAWATTLDDPRRGGAPLWAPLPANAAGEIYGHHSMSIGGPIRRISNVRASFKGVQHAGIDTPASVAVALPVFAPRNVNQKPLPTEVLYGPSYYKSAKDQHEYVGVRLTSNSPFYQQIVRSDGANALLGLTLEYGTAVVARGTATTDASGFATVAYSYPPVSSVGSKWLTISAIAGSSSGAGRVIVVTAQGSGSVTFKSLNATDGSVAPNVGFTYELLDNGGSTFVSAWIS